MRAFGSHQSGRIWIPIVGGLVSVAFVLVVLGWVFYTTMSRSAFPSPGPANPVVEIIGDAGGGPILEPRATEYGEPGTPPETTTSPKEPTAAQPSAADPASPRPDAVDPMEGALLAKVSGRVLSRIEHAPVAGARVLFAKLRMPVHEAVTGPDGTWSTTVEASQYFIKVEHDQYRSLALPGLRSIREDRANDIETVFLEPGVGIYGTVLGTDGMALVGAAVVVEQRGGAWEGNADSVETVFAMEHKRAVVDARGNYRVSGLTPGEYWLVVTGADGTERGGRFVSLRASRDRRVDISDATAVRVHGRVTYAGSPLAKTTLSFYTKSEHMPGGPGSGTGKRTATTGDEGEYEVYLPPGRHEIAIANQRLAFDVPQLSEYRRDFHPGTEGIRLKLTLPGGAPYAGTAQVVLRDQRSAASRTYQDLAYDAHYGFQTLQFDQNNPSRLVAAGPGEYRLSVFPFGFGQVSALVRVTEDSVAELRVQVGPRGHNLLGHISGVPEDYKGNTVLSIFDPDNTEIMVLRVSPTWRFQVPGLRPGRYRLVAVVPGGNTNEWPVDIRKDDNPVVSMELPFTR